MVRKNFAVWLGVAVIAMSAMMTVACSTPDTGVTTAVKGKLAADDTVKPFKIDVVTKDGVVTLAG